MSLDKNDDQEPRRPRPGPCPRCGNTRTTLEPDPNATAGFLGDCERCDHQWQIGAARQRERRENARARADAAAMKKLEGST